MNLNTEAKVGAVSLLGLALLAYIIIHLGSFSFGDKGYPVKAVFGQVGGLKAGNVVRYAGVDVGRVESIDVTSQGVQVLMMINPGVKIPQGSKIAIGTDGLLGEKFIEITPPQTHSKFVEPNDTLRGEDPKGFDSLMVTAETVMVKFEKLIDTLNDIFTDDIKVSIKATILNTKAITENLNVLSAAMARMAVNSEADIAAMVKNLHAMSESLRSVTARVDMLVANFDNNGQTARDLREAVANIKATSVRIENMAKTLEGVVTDPKTAKNIKETLQNAHDASEKANKMLSKIESVHADASFEVLYKTDNDEGKKYRSNADVRIQTTPRDFAVIGVAGIGDDNKLNLQVGKGTDKWSQRAGVIQGKAGIGVDSHLNKDLRLSLDVYDPNDIRVKLRSEYKIAPDTYVIGQTDSLNKEPEKNTYIGLRRTF